MLINKNKNENKEESNISFLECIKVLLIVSIALLIPSIIIGFVVKLATKIGFIFSCLIGFIIVLGISCFLGFHEPATKNYYEEDNNYYD